jgi:hypothetical protein
VNAIDAAVSVPVLFRSHQDLLDVAAAQPALAEWSRAMSRRYLPAT